VHVLHPLWAASCCPVWCRCILGYIGMCAEKTHPFLPFH